MATLNLDAINAEWSKDSRVDELNLKGEALRIDELHSKYVKLLGSARLAQRKAYAEMLRTRSLKRKYFLGQLSKQELDTLGWEPYLFAKPLKNELDDILNADEDVIKLDDKIEYLSTVVDTLEKIMKAVMSRTYNVKNAITMHMWENGN